MSDFTIFVDWLSHAGVCRNVSRRCGDSPDELLQQIVDALPGSWQYPEITCARIVFAEREYVTAGFERSVWHQAAEFRVSGEKAGVVEVCYLVEMPTIDEGPFLKEERLLIDAVAKRTGKIIQRIHSSRQLQVERVALEQSNIAMPPRRTALAGGSHQGSPIRLSRVCQVQPQ